MKFSYRALVLSSILACSRLLSFAGDEKSGRKDPSPSESSSSAEASSAARSAPETDSGAIRTDAGEETGGPRWLPMPSISGNPGLFTLETGETLPKGAISLMAGANKFSRMPGDITVLDADTSFAVGVTDRLSLFAAWDTRRHVHVGDPTLLSLSSATAGNPQFDRTIYRSILPATGFPPAYVEDVPFANKNDGGAGEVDLGFTINLLSESRGNRLSLSVRNDFYIPTHTSLSGILPNETGYGTFNYGVGLQASKALFHRAMIAALNGAYRWTRAKTFTVVDPVTGLAQPQTLNLADQLRVGVGLMMFPDKRFQLLSEYSGILFFGSATPNTTFGARDPIETISGFRLYLARMLALDLGYRYTINLTNHRDRNGFVAKLGLTRSRARLRAPAQIPDTVTASCSAERAAIPEGSAEFIRVNANAYDSWGHPLVYEWAASGGRIQGAGPTARWEAAGAPAGNYTVSVRVSDGAGNSRSCSVTLIVQPK